MRITSFLFITVLFISVYSCNNEPTPKSKKLNLPKAKPTAYYKFSVDQRLPHSNNSFTEGLLFHKGQLFESTGSPDDLPNTQSVYGVVDSLTGQIDIHNTLEAKYFGEGMCILNNQVYQLTYKSRKGFVYDLESKEKIRSFQLPTMEGWGLTTDGESLIMTDGTPNLHFMDPITLEKTGTVKVFDNGRPVRYLNEVEYVDGFIYANVFTTDWILKIDVETGKVVGRLDVTDLKLEEDKLSSKALETNGIAYNPETNQFYITGKMWKNIYVISLFE